MNGKFNQFERYSELLKLFGCQSLIYFIVIAPQPVDTFFKSVEDVLVRDEIGDDINALHHISGLLEDSREEY